MNLFARALATLTESWAYLASGSPGAELIRTDDAAIAVFVHPPDREFLNNAVLERRPADLGSTVAAIEDAYSDQGVERFAIWAHESDRETVAGLGERGYRFETSTRTMAMPLEALSAVDLSTSDIAAVGAKQFWAVDGPAGMVPHLDPQRAHFYVARLEGEEVATLMAFDHEGDCGIYMVGTREVARRQGIATALSGHAVAAARERGCATASLQATEMAERVYARIGFRDLGLWHEYVPAT